MCSYCVILVRVGSSRGQRVAVCLLQGQGGGGGDTRECSSTVCGQVEGRLPGPAVIQSPFYDHVTGTRTLQRNTDQIMHHQKYTNSTLVWSSEKLLGEYYSQMKYLVRK